MFILWQEVVALLDVKALISASEDGENSARLTIQILVNRSVALM